MFPAIEPADTSAPTAGRVTARDSIGSRRRSRQVPSRRGDAVRGRGRQSRAVAGRSRKLVCPPVVWPCSVPGVSRTGPEPLELRSHRNSRRADVSGRSVEKGPRPRARCRRTPAPPAAELPGPGPVPSADQRGSGHAVPRETEGPARLSAWAPVPARRRRVSVGERPPEVGAQGFHPIGRRVLVRR